MVSLTTTPDEVVPDSSSTFVVSGPYPHELVTGLDAFPKNNVPGPIFRHSQLTILPVPDPLSGKKVVSVFESSPHRPFCSMASVVSFPAKIFTCVDVSTDVSVASLAACRPALSVTTICKFRTPAVKGPVIVSVVVVVPDSGAADPEV